jgi:hypothetical protein
MPGNTHRAASTKLPILDRKTVTNGSDGGVFFMSSVAAIHHGGSSTCVPLSRV